MTFSIEAAMEKASQLENWTAAYVSILCSLGIDGSDPKYFFEALTTTGIDPEMMQEWQGSPTKRQWLISRTAAHEIMDSLDRRIEGSAEIMTRISKFLGKDV